MKTIDNIMKLATDLAYCTDDEFGEIKVALRAAIEQALNSQVPDGYVLVKSGALQMVVNALRRDAADGKTVRGEMADELIAVNHNHNDKQALGQGEPVAWLESPYGSIRMNPNMRMDFPPQSLKWRIPLYPAPQPQRDDTALLMEAMSLLMQMPIKHPQQGEYRDDLIRRIRERLK
jgi:hypothetical protein